ncbi:MHC class II transactivator isoform X2 [Lepisosteus oculatus]|uniref:MHC class II transactivator isoform X2 n=1 Tax=Lepisosteus oculatus TaxID=7918 RepID=UPI0007401A55|nr:PREDICTED: MHC class II transactivator isoform X2 [Lepisosteus oculatus]
MKARIAGARTQGTAMETLVPAELELLHSDSLLPLEELYLSSDDSFPTDDDGNQLSLESSNLLGLLCSPFDAELECCYSPSSQPLEDRENIERILRFLQDDQPEILTGETEMRATTPEATGLDTISQETKVKKTNCEKRDHNSTGIISDDSPKLKRRRDPRHCRRTPKLNKRNKKCLEVTNSLPNKGISPPAVSTCSLMTLPAAQGVLQINSSPVPQVLQFSIPANGSPTLIAHCTSSFVMNNAAVQVYPSFPQHIIATPHTSPVGSSVNSRGPTFVLVPPVSLTSSQPQASPSSPAPGSVVGPESVNQTSVISSADSISTLSPASVSSPASTADTGMSPHKGSTAPPLQSSQCSEMPKCVEDYIATAKAFMYDNCQLMAIENEVALDSLYIDVPLVQRQIKTRTGKHVNKYQEKELLLFDMAERRKFEIKRSQLFEEAGQKPKELIALLGKAGMGKSTFIQKLCLDWSKGDFQHFELVFFFETKKLNLPDQTYSLKNLLFDIFPAPPPRNVDEVFRYILSNPQKVLIIFDGFDDFQDSEGLLQCPATSSTKDVYTIKQLFSGLFQKKLIVGSTILIAARPKEVLNQFLGKVDKIVELCGFSEEEIQLYTERYFKDTSCYDWAWTKVRNHNFLSALCFNPLICRFTCFLLENVGSKKSLPSTLTELYQQVFYQKLHMNTTKADPGKRQEKQNIPKLGALAWRGVKDHSCLLSHEDLCSTGLKEFGLNSGILTPYILKRKGDEEEFGCGFTDLFVQNFLGALHITAAKELNDKSLLTQTMLQQKKKKPQDDWLDVTRRFMVGLLFQKTQKHLDWLPGSTKKRLAKRNTIEAHLEKLRPSELSANRLLELCHCVYETGSTKLLRNLAQKLPEELSFSGTPLTPPDVFVLKYLLKETKDNQKNFSIDIQETAIDLPGLRELVGLNCVTSFRASVADTISLWECLQQTGEKDLLKDAVAKFTVNPFKARQLSDVENLNQLVQIYRQKKLLLCDSADSETRPDGDTFHVPAVNNLRKLEFALGPENGYLGFLRLVEVLPTLQWLQHLDLEGLTCNKIGDRGAEKLAEILPCLSSLETLNLSQNCIGDQGAEKLAQTLPSLLSLRSLSLYSNSIADSGAESMAQILPEMTSLTDLDVKFNKITDVGALKLSESLRRCPWIKSIAMWNHSIPHGVLEHLKQKDSRINLL